MRAMNVILASALMALACVLITADSSFASSYGLADGWTEVRPQEGRQAAVFHSESLTRMEAWRIKLSGKELKRFQAQLERRLKGRGFRPERSYEVKLAGGTATVTSWSRTFQERPFTLKIVEVYRQGKLWQFSSTFAEGEGAAVWEEDLITFAGALLSS